MYCKLEPEFVNLLRSPGIDSQPDGPVRQPYLTYRPARLHRLAESFPLNRFLGSFKRLQIGAQKSGLLKGMRCQKKYQGSVLKTARIVDGKQVGISVLHGQYGRNTSTDRREADRRQYVNQSYNIDGHGQVIF